MTGTDIDRGAIGIVIREINESWRAGRYDNIGRHLADDVVIAPPASDQRVRGREAYVQSYRDYDQAATTQEFSAGEPRIDVVGDVAVAVCPFFVVYELEGRILRERGTDLLVLARAGDGWRVCWRSMQSRAAE